MMAVHFYMDVHIPQPITDGLRMRGVNVLTAQENGGGELDDSDLLDRATQLNRILVSFDKDLLRIAASYQRNEKIFAGVIHSRSLKVSISACVRDLELIAKATNPSDWINKVEYLPL
jgi:predicted nuclease of predicted toxin-antitoxin system